MRVVVQLERELEQRGVQGVQAAASAQVAEMEAAVGQGSGADEGQGADGSCAWEDAEGGECRPQHDEL